VAEYIPTPGPHEGEQWEPSNGTIGESFIRAWCAECARDKVMNGEATQEQADADDSLYCQILGASFRGEAVEWREVGDEVKCIAFVPKGQPIPAPRCQHTAELSLGFGTPGWVGSPVDRDLESIETALTWVPFDRRPREAVERIRSALIAAHASGVNPSAQGRTE
jgi:hypothetical protein